MSSYDYLIKYHAPVSLQATNYFDGAVEALSLETPADAPGMLVERVQTLFGQLKLSNKIDPNTLIRAEAAARRLKCSSQPILCRRSDDSDSERTLVVTKTCYYILLKTKDGFEATNSSATRCTPALRVRFDGNKKVSLVYQLVNHDSAPRMTLAELALRKKGSDKLPDVVDLFHYEKEDIPKTMAFIKCQAAGLYAFDPARDDLCAALFENAGALLPSCIEHDDRESIEFIKSKHVTPGQRFQAITKAAKLQRLDYVRLLIRKDDPAVELQDAFDKAVKIGDSRMVRYFLNLRCGNDFDALAAMAYAVLHDSDDILMLLFDRLKQTASSISEAIIACAALGKMDTFTFVLSKKGSHVIEGRAVAACFFCNQKEMGKACLAIKPVAEDAYSKSLWVAAEKSDFELMEFLLQGETARLADKFSDADKNNM